MGKLQLGVKGGDHLKNDIANSRAEIHGEATNILDARSLFSSHKRLAEVLEEGMVVLDIGCGTGAITKDIAKIVGENGNVVGIDNNPSLIKKANELYENISNLSFEVESIYDHPFNNQFDIVTCARVVQWLCDPIKALKSMVTATKSGGKILIVDYNHEKIKWEPKPPESTSIFYTAFLKWRADAGMDNKIADHLNEWFLEIGLSNINVSKQHEVVNRQDEKFKDQIGIWAGVMASRGVQMVKDNYITEAERCLAEKEYRDWIKKDAISQSMYLLAVEGVKN